MKPVCYLIGIIAFACCSGQNPYASLKYDSLVIYDFDWRSPEGRFRTIIDKNGQLPPSIKKSTKLSKTAADELSHKIGEWDSYGQITAACFDPHFGIVYYENGEVKEYITICLACNFPRPSLEIPARNQGPEEYDEGTYFTRMGFSTSMRKYLSALKQKHGFSHSDIRSDIFDKD